MHKYVRASLTATATVLLVGPAAAVAGSGATPEPHGHDLQSPAIVAQAQSGDSVVWAVPGHASANRIEPQKPAKSMTVKVVACKVTPTRKATARTGKARTVLQMCFHAKDLKSATPNATKALPMKSAKGAHWFAAKPIG